MDLDAIVTKLNQWASSRSAIRRLWIYGSRARGDAHPKSDLDVALELVVALPHETATDVWFENIGNWRSDLSGRFPFPVQLELLDGATTPTIQSGTARDGVLVYETAA